ncbi:MAG: alpha/beta hydrolase [Kutzneria sp.]|nr:alpha/beta hydrolase [Kutzneria sp.]MBV9846488.1 alpha/beta hydrolase [Kutzneria sp.]
MGTLITNGIRTHYQYMPARCADPRAAPTVVFIHGLGTDSLASFYLTLASPVAAAGINVIAYDLRGHGRSDRPLTGYAVDAFVDDLASLLGFLDPPGPVHLVGNSFGGTLAFSYAWTRPAQVASIVSIEAEPATASWSDRIGRLLRYVSDELTKQETFASIERDNGVHYARLARAAASRLHETTMVGEVPRGPVMDSDELYSISCPVLSILGGEGQQKDDPYRVAGMLRNCRTVILPGYDHSVLVDAHRKVRELLVRWVQETHAGTLSTRGPADATPVVDSVA